MTKFLLTLLNFHSDSIHFLKEVHVIFLGSLFQKFEFYEITKDCLLIWLCYKMLENTMGLSVNCSHFIFIADLTLNSYNTCLRKLEMRLKEILAEILGINVVIHY